MIAGKFKEKQQELEDNYKKEASKDGNGFDELQEANKKYLESILRNKTEFKQALFKEYNVEGNRKAEKAFEIAWEMGDGEDSGWCRSFPLAESVFVEIAELIQPDEIEAMLRPGNVDGWYVLVGEEDYQKPYKLEQVSTDVGTIKNALKRVADKPRILVAQKVRRE